uniref:Uncharacterized protein n=1 Tax=Cacopsylla melanoneura TaxID=428564 RepID=A0A8D8ZGK2_9HEMI
MITHLNMVTKQLVLFLFTFMVFHEHSLCHADVTSHQQAANHETHALSQAPIKQKSIHDDKKNPSTHSQPYPPTKHHASTAQTRPLDTDYDLSRVKHLSRSDLEADFTSIILTMRWKGRQVLDHFDSDLLHLIFSNPHGEPEKVIQERWEAQCDFFLNHRDLDHFESYVLSGDDQFIDMAGLTTSFFDAQKF